MGGNTKVHQRGGGEAPARFQYVLQLLKGGLERKKRGYANRNGVEAARRSRGGVSLGGRTGEERPSYLWRRGRDKTKEARGQPLKKRNGKFQSAANSSRSRF